MKKPAKELPEPYEAPKDRSALEDMMNRPIEEYFVRRMLEGIDHQDLPQPEKDIMLDPNHPTNRLREQMRTESGSREILSEFFNTVTIEGIKIDRMYQTEIMELSQGRDNLCDIEQLQDRRQKNINSIIKINIAKKRLLTLPGINFQLNVAQGHQQVNNNTHDKNDSNTELE